MCYTSRIFLLMTRRTALGHGADGGPVDLHIFSTLTLSCDTRVKQANGGMMVYGNLW